MQIDLLFYLGGNTLTTINSKAQYVPYLAQAVTPNATCNDPSATAPVIGTTVVSPVS